MRPHQSHHRITECLTEAANLTILALFEGELKPGLSIFDAQLAHCYWFRRLAVDDDRLLKSLQTRLVHLALYLGHIRLFDFAFWVEQPERKVAIVRQNQHAAGGIVETTNRNQPHGQIPNE